MNLRGLPDKTCIPHPDHGIRRGGHHQIDALILETRHIRGILDIFTVMSVHGSLHIV